MVEHDLSGKTITSRITMVDVVCRHSGVSDPHDLTANHIRMYIQDHGLEPASVRKYLEHISLWARFAAADDPTASIRKPKTPKYRPRPLTTETYSRVMAHLSATDPLTHLWARLGGELGLRAFEVAKIQGKDLDASSRTLYVLGKAGLATTIDVPDNLFEALWQRSEGTRGALWPGVKGQRVSGDVAIGAAQIGVQLKFHQFRHTAITRYYQKTLDLIATQHFARHQSPETTAIYALADLSNHREILNSLHSDQPEPEAPVRDDDAELLAVLRRAGLSGEDLLRLLLERRSGEIKDD
ncbi:tyrosine-type recombinase/integrase [Streptomyces triticagri]|nr:site-specific integrase [Streptomyces triticagri]